MGPPTPMPEKRDVGTQTEEPPILPNNNAAPIIHAVSQPIQIGGTHHRRSEFDGDLLQHDAPTGVLIDFTKPTTLMRHGRFVKRADADYQQQSNKIFYKNSHLNNVIQAADRRHALPLH